MLTLSEDAMAICRRIDDGDDEAVLILADSLEDASDPRAAGLRKVFREGHRPEFVAPNGTLSATYRGWQIGHGHAHSIGGKNGVLASLHRNPLHLRWGDWFLFDTRSAAFLALAEAAFGE